MLPVPQRPRECQLLTLEISGRESLSHREDSQPAEMAGDNSLFLHGQGLAQCRSFCGRGVEAGPGLGFCSVPAPLTPSQPPLAGISHFHRCVQVAQLVRVGLW